MASPPKPATARANTGFFLAITSTAIIGIGVGASFGWLFAAKPMPHVVPNKSSAPASEAVPPKIEARSSEISTDHVIALDPVITNLLAPDATWVRFEGSVVFKSPLEAERGALLKQIAQDLMGYLRSTKLRQLETAAGIEFLREDMAELVRLRSKGRARDLIVRVLVVE